MNLTQVRQNFRRLTKYPWFQNNWLGITIILASWVAFFSRTIIGRAIYFLDDLKIIYYPLETVYATFQQAGTLPEWSPLFGFGHPLLAWAQLGFFTPFHLILRSLAVPPLILLQASILFYFAMGLLGMYLFTRRLKLSQLSASLAAIVFTFNGFNVGHLNHVNFYTGTMLLPWLLLTILLLVAKPTLTRALTMSLLVSAIVLSAQPQVILYTTIIAAIIGISLLLTHIWSAKMPRRILVKYLLHITALTILATLLTLGLSSFTTLPLLEFLPQTERADGMEETVLFEFSYPPQHAITLILPFFFGNHNSYWGAKGFQELAAYIGILPLLLLGTALAASRKHLPLVASSIILILISILFALGEHSFVYEYLVTHKFITSLAIPGRFVYFFVVAASLLSGIGLDTIIHRPNSRFSRMSIAVLGILVASMFLSTFIINLQDHERLYPTLFPYLTLTSPVTLSLIGGLLIFIIGCFMPRFTLWSKSITILIVLWSAATLIIIGWQYNPVTDPALAFNAPDWHQSIKEYNNQHSTPARLYSTEHLLRILPNTVNLRKTESLSPLLTLFQPWIAEYDNLSCLSLPAFLQGDSQGTVYISIFRHLDQNPLRTITLHPSLLVSSHQQPCFTPIATTPGEKFYIKLSSPSYSGFRLFLYPTDQPEEQVLLIRKPDYTLNEVLAARKPLKLLIQPQAAANLEKEMAFGSRHLNVIAGASSARWIGALSIRPYREFIEMFFANDREQFDGDGFHAIERQRRIFDLSGVTHFAQPVPLNESDEAMVQQNFSIISRQLNGSSDVTLYKNTQALPPAFLTPQAEFVPTADESRFRLLDPNFDIFSTAIINGPIPPNNLPLPETPTLDGQAVITNYQPTKVDIKVTTNRDAWLILSDSTTSQWHTLLDGKPAPQYTAYTLFKAAFVPAGEHTVTFYYHSPAISRAKSLTIGSMLIILLLFLLSAINSVHNSPHTKPTKKVTPPEPKGRASLLTKIEPSTTTII